MLIRHLAGNMVSRWTDFLTTDEAYHWIARTERFAAAVGEGRWADTILTAHARLAAIPIP